MIPYGSFITEYTKRGAVEEFLDEYGYIALMIGTFFEGETAILVASSLIYTGLFSVPKTVFFAFAGSFISDWLYYTIGHLNGKYFIEKRPSLKARVLPVWKFFEKHKLQILFSYRFLYGFRVIIPLIIGMSSVKPLEFLMYSLLTGVLWASTVSLVGYLIGRFLEIKTDAYEDNITLIVLAFASIGILIGYIVKRMTTQKILKEL